MVDFNNINTIDLFIDDNILLINQDSSIFTKDNLQREAEKVGIPKSDIKYGIKQIKSTLEQRLNNLTQLESIHEQNNYDKEKTLKQVMERNKLLKRGVLDELDKIEKKLPINFSNFESLQQYISDNIILINSDLSRFTESNTKQELNEQGLEEEIYFQKTDIENELKMRLTSLNEYSVNRLIADIGKNDYDINLIAESFAKKNEYYKTDIREVIENGIENEIRKLVLSQSDEVSKDFLESIEKRFDTEEKNKFALIKNNLSVTFHRFLPLILSQGFSTKVNRINTGTTTANEGDSSQFIFVARAILAGFESSNVDVRSSRYDCIVEFKDKIFRIQVKGFKDDALRFKSRSRGGKGIDPNNPSNKGRRITHEDCDIYAGVDKKTGIIYLIPIKDVENIKEDAKNVKYLEKYRENWKIFEELLKQSQIGKRRIGISTKNNRKQRKNHTKSLI